MVGEKEAEDPVLAAILENEVGLLTDTWDAEAVVARWGCLHGTCLPQPEGSRTAAANLPISGCWRTAAGLPPSVPGPGRQHSCAGVAGLAQQWAAWISRS